MTMEVDDCGPGDGSRTSFDSKSAAPQVYWEDVNKNETEMATVSSRYPASLC